MTTVRGRIRSTATQTAEGHADDPQTARAEALAGLDLTTNELLQANTVTAKASGDITIRATARSRDTRDHEASGANYAAAMNAFRSSVPDGFSILYITAAD
ncbi:hypothetical protein [Curtobacterium sp. MCSS17_016]|uniref:hypothetical protein n=1 Tax=Curtobacterium sp. MCSS17_016 TaxID=2175644 RepID=UPI000DA9B99A|nr:hypothetical protein [Curtobacterium sp. MCSS17_016]WIE81029.1 hypothetical protein DEJ19_021165 [Curtobacterium sp. MCSS17_016]